MAISATETRHNFSLIALRSNKNAYTQNTVNTSNDPNIGETIRNLNTYGVVGEGFNMFNYGCESGLHQYCYGKNAIREDFNPNSGSFEREQVNCWCA